MFNPLKMQYVQNKPLFFFTLVSLLIHLLFIAKFSLSLPEMDEGQRTIEMRLVQLPEKKIQSPTPALSSLPEIKTTSPSNPEKVHDIPDEESTKIEHNTAPNIEDPSIQPAYAESSAQTDNITHHPEIDSIELPTTSEIDAPTDKESIDAENIPLDKTGEMPQKPSPQGYKYVESEFTITRGTGTSPVGTARVIFNIDDNGTYLITSLTEAKGLVSLFLGKLTQKSVGVVNETGLQPDFFSYQYGNDASKEQTARFSWKQGVLHLRSEKVSKTEPLNSGTQDLLSFMYQFMFSPPLDNTQVIVTNGKNLRTYAYQFVGETTITTGMGNINTIHLIKTDDNQEKTELWLATDYQYLPVKIRKTEKNGEVIEQMITKMSSISR
jgi:hypothetical protein